MPNQITPRQFMRDMPQRGERWEFVSNGLVGEVITRGTVANYSVRLGQSVVIELDTAEGLRSVNLLYTGLVSARRIPHVIEPRGVLAEIPEASEFEGDDPDA